MTKTTWFGLVGRLSPLVQIGFAALFAVRCVGEPEPLATLISRALEAHQRGDAAQAATLYDAVLVRETELTPTVAAVSSSGQLVWHHATAGLLRVDATAAGAAPPIQVLYSGGESDCCAAPALAISKDVVVASIPDGTVDPPWCNCRHSTLLGVQL